jgi:hypothetical protein
VSRYLLLYSAGGRRAPREDIAILSEYDTLTDAYTALDCLAEAFGSHVESAARCYVADDTLRPVERPREMVQ